MVLLLFEVQVASKPTDVTLAAVKAEMPKQVNGAVLVSAYVRGGWLSGYRRRCQSMCQQKCRVLLATVP